MRNVIPFSCLALKHLCVFLLFVGVPGYIYLLFLPIHWRRYVLQSCPLFPFYSVAAFVEEPSRPLQFLFAFDRSLGKTDRQTMA